MSYSNILLKIKQHKWLIVSIGLWVMLWAGYNTGIERVLAPGFPINAIDLIHGLRSFLPILAGFLVLCFLFIKRKSLSKNFLFSPLGLLLLFSILGIISSLIFSTEPLRALYWALMYVSVLLVLLTIINGINGLKNLRYIIRINWIIAAVLALGLIVFFFLQFNASESFSFNSLICSGRPYEKLAGIKAETDIFGMAGTRPTGLGRYAGIAALVLFVSLIYRQGLSKVVSGIWFFLFLLITFFARGRAVMVSFSGSMAFILLILKKIKTYWALLFVMVILASGFLVLYKEPCSSFINGQSSEQKESDINGQSSEQKESEQIMIEKQPLINSKEQIMIEKQPLINSKELKKIATLTGRTTGVWNDSINLFFNSPILGYGFQSDRIFLNGQHAHNSIIHALIQSGMLGLIPFVLAFALTIAFLFRLFKRSLIDQKEKVFLIEISAILVFILLRSITESFAYYSADWLFLAPIIAYIQVLYINRNKKNE